MPQIVNCPDCERKLRIPDTMLGKTVQCPTCCVKFKASVAGGNQTEEEPPRTKPRQAAGRDERVSTRPERTTSREEEPVSRARRRAEEEEDDRPGRRRRAEEEEEDRPSRRRRDEDEDYPRSRRSRDHDDDDDDRRFRRSRDDEEFDLEHERSSWQKVRTGLNLVAIGTWVWIFGFFLGGIFLLLALVLGYHTVSSFDASSGGSGTLGNLGMTAICAGLGVILMGVGGFFEMVLRVIGYGLCLAAPGKQGTGLKPLAITAFVLVGLNTLFKVGNVFLGGVSSFAGSLPGMMGHGGAVASHGSGTLGYLIGLLTFASFVVFLFFLRSVCRYIGQRRLGGQMITAFIVFLAYYIVSGIIMVVLIMITVGSTALSLSGSREGSMGAAMTTLGTMAVVSILVACLLALGYLGLHVWYVVLLQKTRAALEGHRQELQG